MSIDIHDQTHWHTQKCHYKPLKVVKQGMVSQHESKAKKNSLVRLVCPYVVWMVIVLSKQINNCPCIGSLFIRNHRNALKIHKVVAFRIYVKKDLWLKRVTSPFGRKNHLVKKKHITRSQKGHQMSDIINQNHFFLLLLSFETIVIMTSYSFFSNMDVKQFRMKIHLIQF